MGVPVWWETNDLSCQFTDLIKWKSQQWGSHFAPVISNACAVPSMALQPNPELANGQRRKHLAPCKDAAEDSRENMKQIQNQFHEHCFHVMPRKKKTQRTDAGHTASAKVYGSAIRSRMLGFHSQANSQTEPVCKWPHFCYIYRTYYSFYLAGAVTEKCCKMCETVNPGHKPLGDSTCVVTTEVQWRNYAIDGRGGWTCPALSLEDEHDWVLHYSQFQLS